MAREQINDSSKNERGSWDAYKLVREYVGIAWMLNYSEQLENLPWDNQVRVQRVASAICAFLSKDAVAIKRRNRQTLWGWCTDANPKLLLNDT